MIVSIVDCIHRFCYEIIIPLFYFFMKTILKWEVLDLFWRVLWNAFAKSINHNACARDVGGGEEEDGLRYSYATNYRNSHIHKLDVQLTHSASVHVFSHREKFNSVVKHRLIFGVMPSLPHAQYTACYGHGRCNFVKTLTLENCIRVQNLSLINS